VSTTAENISLDATIRQPAADTGLPCCGLDNSYITIIEPLSGWRLVNARELWKFRELLGFLIWRDVKVRYKQTLLGAAWAVLQPLLMMIVFTIFFARMAEVNSGGHPYPLFAFAGLLPWTFFSTAIANAGNSVVGNERLISKIYFPRLIIPFSSVGAALVDFVVAFGMMIVLMVSYRVTPTAQLICVPLVVALVTIAALGVGTVLASLNVAYRDFRYVIPFLVQLWMFATPTVYMQPAEYALPQDVAAANTRSSGLDMNLETGHAVESHRALPGYIHTLLDLNPLVGLIASFRAAVLGDPMPWRSLGLSAVGAALMFIVGCLYFRHVENSFADII
jgi:lipopolysaccharide transport system permease protein